MQSAYDVIVIGAGPIGMLSALVLAQNGNSVVVLEAEDQINDSPRAASYYAPSMLALRELGILDEVEAQGIKGDKMGFRAPSLGIKLTTHVVPCEGVPWDYQIHLGQHKMVAIAMRHAERLGAQTLFNHRVVGIRQDEDWAYVAVETGDGKKEFRSRYVIGADGARSTVRKLLNIEFDGFTWPTRFIATNLRIDFFSLGYEHANFICDGKDMGIVALVDEGLWRLSYQEDTSLPAESFMERIPQNYARFIPEGTPYEIVSANPYSIHQRCATRLREGRILLAGDSAHATNPCGGLGITTGIWDGLVLADILTAVMTGDEDPEILDRYSDERRRIFWEVTSPAATENKRILDERDPHQLREDMAGVEAMATDPEKARLWSAFSFRLIGDVLRPNSRWIGMDPTGAAASAARGRISQIA